MKKSAAADIVIFGGGVAGLWLLNRLRQTGLSVILFETCALGGGQTHASQGIIHGGMKYALNGVLSKESQVLSDMPKVWADCLAGKGEIDLTSVPLLSSKQYLWSPYKFTSKLTGFLASAALTSKVEALPKHHYPAIFQDANFKGDVFSLDEMVIDVPCLLRELVKANQDAVYKIEPLSEDALVLDKQGNLVRATVYFSGMAVDVTAQQFIFTAGAGNEVILNKLNLKDIAMQRRPLHMVMVKLPFHYPLYAHCLGLASRPRITITTHRTHDAGTVWYLGGALAENGVGLDRALQIKAARKELEALFPWLDFNQAEFATFLIDRAEPKQKGGLKPETAYVKAVRNMLVGWPTKLALAPKLSRDVLKHFEQLALSPQFFDIRELRAWPMPPLAAPIWEDVFCKNA